MELPMTNFYINRRDRSNTSPATLWRTWDSFASDFDSFFEDFDRALGNGKPQGKTENSGRGPSFAPAADVHENDKGYELSFDMPGFKNDEISIDLNGRTLSVSGHRERSTSDSKLHRSEKFYGEYRRSITLPENIKSEQIEASYENGVLSIQLPKAQLAEARKIQIGMGKASETGRQSNGNGRSDLNSARDVEQQQNLSH
jgi:HSP20 family protein